MAQPAADRPATFFQRRIVAPIRALLLEGITPQKIALSLTCGIVLGIFPVVGTTTLLCTLAVLLLRLNLPATQLVNYLVYPAQLALILPFIRAGEFLLHVPRTPLSLAQMMSLFHSNPRQAMHLLWLLVLHGIFAWMLVAPIAYLLFYRIFLHAINKLAAQIQRRRTQKPSAGAQA